MIAARILVLAALVSHGLSADNGLTREPLVLQFFKILHSLLPQSQRSDDFSHLLQLKDDYVASYQSSGSRGYDPDSLPYFKIFPEYIATLAPGSEAAITNSCWTEAKVSNELQDDSSSLVTVSLHGPSSLLCHVSLILSSGSEIHVEEFWEAGEHSVTFRPPVTEAERWDMLDRGPRLFVYPISPEIITYNLAASLALFEPVLSQGVGEVFADMNREFLSAFVGIEMEPRAEGVPDILNIPEEEISNGDTFDIMRLDGLDPMIAWAMGAATGHTAVAMRRQGRLEVCESNALTPYWPVNGVQCNSWANWTQFALAADYNVVWAPLKPEISRIMDMETAWDFVESMRGVDYGYEVVLTGLLDTLYDNLPCASQSEDTPFCLEPEHFEMLFTAVERLSSEVARVFKPAMMQRAGVPGDRPLLEAYHAASLAGVEVTRLPLVPETDGWLYETKRDGEAAISPVMICNVFVCGVWKAAGVFRDIGDDIQCGETSVNDNYRLAVYSDRPAPSYCLAADPNNPLCQLTGRYQLRLDTQPGEGPRFNYVPLQPGLLETCPSLAPDYLAPPDC